MKRHRHLAIDSTKRYATSGGPMPHCAGERYGKWCSNSCRMTGSCKCGAAGVWCPDHGWRWTPAEETNESA